MSSGQVFFVVEAAGTVLTIVLRLVTREKMTWRFAFSFLWPLILVMYLVALLARVVGGKDWMEPAPIKGHEDDHLCSVCHRDALISFDELANRAQAVIDGKSEDIQADCKLFAPIVQQFIKQHRWDRS